MTSDIIIVLMAPAPTRPNSPRASRRFARAHRAMRKNRARIRLQRKHRTVGAPAVGSSKIGRSAGGNYFRRFGPKVSESVGKTAVEQIGLAFAENASVGANSDLDLAGNDDAALMGTVFEAGTACICSGKIMLVENLQAVRERIAYLAHDNLRGAVIHGVSEFRCQVHELSLIHI